VADIASATRETVAIPRSSSVLESAVVGAEPSAALPAQARSLLWLQERAGNGAVSALVQRATADVPENRVDSGAALLALLDELHAAATVADELAAETGTPPPTRDLNTRLDELRDLAESGDEAVKARVLAALRSELRDVGRAPSLGEPVHHQVAQRVGPDVLLGGAVVVAGLAYLVKRTYEYIRDRRENAMLAEHYSGGRRIVNRGIPAELTAGIAVLPNAAAKAARLFANLNNFRFRYEGAAVGPSLAFQVHQGDCQTLVGIYGQVALAMGIPFTRGTRPERQLVAPRPIHGRSTEGNTEGNTDWYFREHFWAIGAGTPYDLLFMVTPPPHAVLIVGTDTNAPPEHRGVSYYRFTDGRCVIEPPQAALDVQIQGEGHVFADEAATIAYINSHTPPPPR
jgi:hypothetical protein